MLKYALSVLVLLSGCTDVQYVPCPVIPTYTAQYQKELEAAVIKNPAPIIVNAINDYIGVRDQIRKCQEKIK